MAELKTKPNNSSVTKYINDIEDTTRRKDCREILTMMRHSTQKKPKMWGESMVGFGNYQYVYKSGHSGEWFITGFSSRKQNLTIYIMPGFSTFESLLNKLGKYKKAKSCLYIKGLDDIDRSILNKLITQSVHLMAKLYPSD